MENHPYIYQMLPFTSYQIPSPSPFQNHVRQNYHQGYSNEQSTAAEPKHQCSPQVYPVYASSQQKKDQLPYDANRGSRPAFDNKESDAQALNMTDFSQKLNSLDKKLDSVDRKLDLVAELMDMVKALKKDNDQLHTELQEIKRSVNQSRTQPQESSQYHQHHQHQPSPSGWSFSASILGQRSFTICVLRTKSATKSFVTFEKDLEHWLNTSLQKAHRSAKVNVLKMASTAELAKQQKVDLVLVCAFSSSVRVDSDAVIPTYQEVQSLRNCSVVRNVVFRYGEKTVPAKICSPKSENGSEEEEIASLSINFTTERDINQTSSVNEQFFDEVVALLSN